jgi:hypothetical protein
MDEDVEGHGRARVVIANEDDTSGHNMRARASEDDTEGHGARAR